MIASVIPLQPTGVFPLSLLSTTSRGAMLNRLTYTFAQQLAWQPFRTGVNRFRKRLGLKPAPLTGHFGHLHHHQVINGFSRHVVPPPPDWGDHVHTTGYWILDEQQWIPSRELLHFLESGSPPIFVGFGSMPISDPVQTIQLVTDALRQSNQRGVLSSGWATLRSQAADPNIFWLDYAPYEWLFPRMAAVVHHGGSGTTGLGLRAGVPSLVIPFGADQPYWGQRVTTLGVGPQSIPFKALAADRLADAIQSAVRDLPMRQRAAELGAKLRAENGLGTAVEIINRYLNK